MSIAAEGASESAAPANRVVFYCDAHELGGAERSLANLLAELGPRIEAFVIGTHRRVVEELANQREGAKAIVLEPIRRKRDIGAIARHTRVFRAIRPDILQVNLASPWESHWAILAGLALRIPTIAVEHLPRPTTRRRQRVLKRLTTPRLAAHVAVGELAADELAALTGTPRVSITTIHNGVPDIPLEPMPRVAGQVVGSIGRLERQKGYDVLLEALAQLPNVKAVLVGEGSERTNLEQLAHRLGIGERVLFRGWSEAARSYLPTFDLFVCPSRFEAFPLVIVEAMLARRAVVASNVGSVSEAVIDGVTGRLVAPDCPVALADALRDLLDEPERVAELGRLGRERALERFTTETMARAYEQLYAEIVARATRAP